MTRSRDPMSEPVRTGRHFLTAAGRSIVPLGAHVVPREGPDWPWRTGAEAFEQAFAQLAALGLNTARIDVLWQAVEPEPGRYDQAHLQILDEILSAARRHGLWLHPALLVGGEVGDAFWDVPWREGRNPHADARLRELSADHARTLAQRWHGDPAILGWDLTDEPPYWVCDDTSDADAREWTHALAGALREADPDHLVTIGTASQDHDAGPFRADVVAGQLDFACVHPYAIYAPELYPDNLLDARITLSGAFETALAAGAGRPVMVHEFGASSAQFDPEVVATFDRLLIWSSFGRGAIGFLAWCWSDAELAAYRRVPYSRQAHETQFGITDRNGDVLPRGHALAEFAATLNHIDLDTYAAHGPRPQAAVLVPHEYSVPFDPAGYGLDGPSGLYLSEEEPRRAERDPTPLVRGWLNAFVLAARAGLSVEFLREGPHDHPPETRLAMLPAPLTTTTTSLWHVRTGFWGAVTELHDRGATVYLSLSADSAIPDMDRLAGCRIVDRAPAREQCVFRFVQAWGLLRAGDVLALPAAPESLATRGARLRVSDGTVVAVDQDGHPVLVVAERRGGHTVTCAEPIELLLAQVADGHRRHPEWWRLYGGLADLADAREQAWAEHPDVVSGVLHGPHGALLTLTNHGQTDLETAVRLPPGISAQVVACDGTRSLVQRTVPVPAGAGVILVWDVN